MKTKAKGRVIESGKLWWSADEDRLAKTEGWTLFTTDYDGIEVIVIQKIDDPIECDSKQEFASDEAAIDWITAWAALGKRHCLKALLLHNTPTIYDVFIPARCEAPARKRKRDRAET
jgi:hypothetical protein